MSGAGSRCRGLICDQLDALLLANEEKPARERLTLIRIFEELRALGYEGSYDAISSIRQEVACRARRHDGGRLCTAEFCARRGVPVRLVARDRADQRDAFDDRTPFGRRDLDIETEPLQQVRRCAFRSPAP
jgi:hypothetical protein